MARTKKNTPYHPRFDFGSNLDPNGLQTGTLEELLFEINYEREEPLEGFPTVRGTKDGEALKLKNLKSIVRFVRSTSNLTLRSTKEVHALTTLKTIKLLYNCNQRSGAQFVRIIEAPSPTSLASIDFLTSPSTKETRSIKEQIAFAVSQVEKEIDPEELSQIHAICNHEAMQREYRHNTNNAMDTILLTHIHHKDDLLTKADLFLIGETIKFHTSINPVEKEQRLHIATYVHLKLLEYKHRNHLEIITKHSIPEDGIGASRIVKFDHLCQKLSQAQNKTIQPHTSFLGMGDVHVLCNNYPREIAELVSTATGFKYIRRDVASDLKRARLVLYLYLAHIGYTEPQNTTFGIMHVVAAFCSILHQRKTRKKLTDKRSKRYESKHPTPQKQLDAFINGRAKQILFTARYLYIERTVWYGAVFSGTKEKYDRHLQFITAQTELIQDICKSNNHKRILEHLCSYKERMTKKAMEFVVSQNKQDTFYEWANFK